MIAIAVSCLQSEMDRAHRPFQKFTTVLRPGRLSSCANWEFTPRRLMEEAMHHHK